MTFTRANHARVEWKTMIYAIRKRIEREGLNLRGFIWTAEISEKLHYHFHLCVAIDRVNWKTIPERLKFENLWGQRTEIDFVKKRLSERTASFVIKNLATYVNFF